MPLGQCYLLKVGGAYCKVGLRVPGRFQMKDCVMIRCQTLCRNSFSKVYLRANYSIYQLQGGIEYIYYFMKQHLVTTFN